MQTDNEFKKVIKEWTEERLSNVHTALPAKVIGVIDPELEKDEPYVNVQPYGKFKTADGRRLPYPIIRRVPIVFPCGNDGNSGLTFPVYKGDTGLIVFAESQITDFMFGEKYNCDDPRRFSLNDAVFFPGLYSRETSKKISRGSGVCMFHNGSFVRLTGSALTGTIGATSFSFSNGDLIVNGVSLKKQREDLNLLQYIYGRGGVNGV